MNIKLMLLLLPFMLMAGGCIDSQVSEEPTSAEFLDVITLNQLESPPAMPKLLEPGQLSTALFERDFALSPAGNELFYTIQFPDRSMKVMTARKNEFGWSEPVMAEFNDDYSALEVCYHPSGEQLFFASNRPVEGENRGYDIYRISREDGQWGEPENLGPAVNTEKNEFFPSVTATGRLYYCANYDGNEDIYRTALEDGEYQQPERLPAPLNTEAMEFNAAIAADESYIIFSSFGREDGFGGGDLYISYRDENDLWSPAINLGKEINSPALDYCPFIWHKTNALVFTSRRSATKPGVTLTEILDWQMSPGNGNGDIYIISSSALPPSK